MNHDLHVRICDFGMAREMEGGSLKPTCSVVSAAGICRKGSATPTLGRCQKIITKCFACMTSDDFCINVFKKKYGYVFPGGFSNFISREKC